MKQHAYLVGALFIISACQEQIPAVSPERLPAQDSSFTPLTPNQQQKIQAQGQVKIAGTQMQLTLQLPPRPPLFAIQTLYLNDADTISATVSDSHGKTYTPVEADGNGKVPYPSNGIIELSFENVLPDPLLFVELQVQDNNLNINQAELAVVLSHIQASAATATLNFQTTAMAKTLRTLLSNAPDRARNLNLNNLNTLINNITGVGPAYAQRHPTLINTALLAQDLQSQEPGTLTASNYRLNGSAINLSVTGLFATDRIQAQVTDPASPIITRSNGSQNMGRATPGNGFQVRIQEAAGNINRYQLNSTPGPVDLSEGGSAALSVEATSIVGEFRINTFTSFNQQFSDVVMDNSGNFVVAWTSDFQDGDFGGIYTQRYNSLGLPQGNEFRVNTSTVGNQNAASIAMDADGDFVVTWESPHAGTTDIYAQRYNNLGEAQGGEFRVNTFTTDSQLRPFIAMDANGNFTIIWSGSNQDSVPSNVYGQRYNHLGQPQGGEFSVAPAPSGAILYSLQDSPIAMNPDGNHVIAWKIGNNIFARQYNALGEAGTPFRVNTYNTGPKTNPCVAIDNAGNFIIGWNSTGQDGNDLGIYAQRYAANGTPQGGEFPVNLHTTGAQSYPFVAMNKTNGDFVFTWVSPQPGSTRNVITRRYAADGTPQTGEVQVNTMATSNKDFPTLAFAPDGRSVFTWTSFLQDAATGSGVHGQRFGTDGLPILAP